jgi:hypothetical protein
MKDRLVTLAGGLLALYLVFILLVPKTQPDFASYPRMSDNGRHGLSILKDWLAHENIPAIALRKRFDELVNDARLPEQGNLLVMHSPQYHPLRDNEVDWLRSWLSQGNTLLLLVAHSDYPEWSAIQDFDDVVNRYTVLFELGFDLSLGNSSDADNKKTSEVSLFDPFNLPGPETQTEFTLVASHDTPLFQHVGQLVVPGQPYGGHSYELGARENYRATLPLVNEKDSASPAIWQVRIGQGTAIISRFASLLGNDTLARADNAQFIMNLFNLYRGQQGMVIIDDMHQGASDLYDPQAFYADPRLHATLWFLFAFWLLYLVGRSNRIAPPVSAQKTMHAVDFVRAVGGLFARRLNRQTTAQAMFKHFFNDIRAQYGRVQNGEPAWDILENAPRVPQNDISKLRKYYAAPEGAAAKLVPLHNLLLNTRKHLS